MKIDTRVLIYTYFLFSSELWYSDTNNSYFRSVRALIAKPYNNSVLMVTSDLTLRAQTLSHIIRSDIVFARVCWYVFKTMTTVRSSTQHTIQTFIRYTSLFGGWNNCHCLSMYKHVGYYVRFDMNNRISNNV